MRRLTYVCVPCRQVAKSHGTSTCPRCGEDMVCAGTRWRPPSRRDDAAWRKITDGHWLTERPRPRHEGRGVAYPFTSPPVRRGRRRPVPSNLDLARQALDALRVATETSSRPEVGSSTGPDLVEQQDAHGQKGAVAAAVTDLLTYSRHPDPRVRAAVAASPQTPAEVLTTLLSDSDPDIQAIAAGSCALPGDYRLRSRLLRAPQPVRSALARREDLEPRLLKKLLRDPAPQVARTAAAHPAAPWRELARLPLGWVPQERLREVADGAALTLLTELRQTSGERLSLSDAQRLLAHVLT